MTTEPTTVIPEETPATPVAVAAVAEAPKDAARPNFRPRTGDRSGAPRGGSGGDRRGGKRPMRKGVSDRVRSEFDHKTIDVRRVARVVAGGRRFSFAVSIVVGDRKGTVGVGTGKSGDTASAIEKAIRSAKKSAIKIALTDKSSIPHDVEAKYASAVIRIMPTPGRGIVAGSAVRTVLTLAGITDAGAKIFSGSKNKLNIARAAIEALKKMEKPKNAKVVAPVEAVAAPVEEKAV